MKPKISLVAADMDGTLLQSDGTISARTLEAIEQTMAMGVEFIAATGRAIHALPTSLTQRKGFHCGIFSNGALVYDLVTKEALYRNEFSVSETLDLIAEFSKIDAMLAVTCQGASHASRKQMEDLDYYQLDEYTKEHVLNSRKVVENLPETIEKLGSPVGKMTLLFRDMNLRKETMDILGRRKDLQISTSLPKNVEIVKAGCNKGNALEHLIKLWGIPKEEVMAIGDADNDLQMLKASGWPIVMANGQEVCKKIARGITASNDDDGVAKALEEYVLGGSR